MILSNMLVLFVHELSEIILNLVCVLIRVGAYPDHCCDVRERSLKIEHIQHLFILIVRAALEQVVGYAVLTDGFTGRGCHVGHLL